MTWSTAPVGVTDWPVAGVQPPGSGQVEADDRLLAADQLPVRADALVDGDVTQGRFQLGSRTGGGPNWSRPWSSERPARAQDQRGGSGDGDGAQPKT